MTDVDRRDFLRRAAALAALGVVGCSSTGKPDPTTRAAAAAAAAPSTDAAAGLGAEDSAAPRMRNNQPAVRALLVEADQAPLADERMRTLIVRDLANDPLPQPIATAAGRARVQLAAGEPIQLAVRLKVPNFGEVYCYADNDGRGYTRPGNIEFVVDAARTRIRRVREAYERLKPASIPEDRQFTHHARMAMRPIPDTGPRQSRVALAYENLAHGLHAGERLTLSAARHRIWRMSEPRKEFYFGALASHADARGPEYEKLYRQLFNFSTVSWYTWKNEEPPEQRIDYARMDQSIAWCLDRGITPKGFGYVYMSRGATPEWMRPLELPPAPTTRVTTGPIDPSQTRRQFNPRWPYAKLRDQYVSTVRQTMKRYHGRLIHAEIMNEAHDKANLWHLSHEQVLDLAKRAFAAARQGSSTVRRQMNHCCLWAEYAKRANDDGTRRWSPWQFVKACQDHGVEYETIGLQLYYPQHDLFEIERMLDRFAAFKKPIHITEVATASQDGLDKASMRPSTYAPGWHGPWTPTMQADWTEAIYTLCYSKPQIECVGWWDVADAPGHFWPYGGLLDDKLQPKESYHRLRKLQQEWGVGR